MANFKGAWETAAAQHASQTYIYSLAEYNGRLYGGTATTGMLFRLNDAGDAWETVATLHAAQTFIYALAEYNGRLYGSTYPNGMLLRLNTNGDAWETVAAQHASQTTVYSLIEYNGRLYGGTYPNGMLLRLNTNGDAWETVAAQHASQTTVYALAEYNGKLYGGTFLNGMLFRLNDAGNAWETAAAQHESQGYIYSLAEHNGKLYGGTFLNGMLFRLNDAGNAWETVAAQYASQKGIVSLIEYDNRLYGGTNPNGMLFRLNTDGDAWETVAAQHESQTNIYSLAEYRGLLYGGTYPNGMLLKMPLITVYQGHSRKESKLYIRSKENTPGTEDDFDFFETSSCTMTRPKTNWMVENSLTKNNNGEYGLRTELQACYSGFTIKCQRLSEIMYFLSYFFGNTDSVANIDPNNSIFSHKLEPLDITDREMPTFTALYTDGTDTHVMTHCIITNFSLNLRSVGNGVIEATFNGICNLHYDNAGTITKDQINNDWLSGAYTGIIENEPALNFKRCSFYIGSILENIPTAENIDYSVYNIPEITDQSPYINSINITGNNGITGEDLIRAGSYGVLNNQQRKDFTFTAEITLRKNSFVNFDSLITNNSEKGFEINWQGKTIKDSLKYAFVLILPLTQINDISEDNDSPVNQTISFTIHSENIPIVVYAQNKVGLCYNACHSTSVESSSNQSASNSSSSGGLSSSSSSPLDG